jgi:hypothetical protein
VRGELAMKRNDIILIGSILLISLISFLVIKVQSGAAANNAGKVAVVSINSKVAYQFPIDNSKETKRVSFQFGGHTGYLDIKDGAVRMEEMDLKVCPQKICSDTGWINKPHQPIVCLPNKIVVDIEYTGNAADPNAVDNTSY